MAPLKENLRYLLKKHCLGRENAATIRQLALDLLPIRANDREIRRAINELAAEGIPATVEDNMVYFKKEKVAFDWGPIVGLGISLGVLGIVVLIAFLVMRAI